MRKQLLFVGLTLLSLSSYGNTISILSKNINESYSKTVKVSGSFFLGFQFSQKSNIDKLNVLFPSKSTGTLCIDISSIDGRYKASLEHELTQAVSKLNQLEFPTQYQTELTSYKPNELAVKATLGKSCSDRNRKSLLASWSGNIEGEHPVLLIRSDARKDVVFVPNISKSFKCKKFKNEYKVTYDKYCELKGIDITEVGSIKIKRKNLQSIPDEIIELVYDSKK
ncbi:hypothetical protein [Thalassotalea marina]|uniref:Uncharacterized protein n=1 Tax=Thalassotalea marina TaxID=1673741 RepID=A0A919BJ31_9GAMM|nr:hypothetical protein [Thalassotalea marina]GHF94867.1 hypothetical protein GCM10017161_23960 [Thalassotalea marina]